MIDSYLQSHKGVAQFKTKSFPFYRQFTAIYRNDRAIGKDSQTAADIIKELEAEPEGHQGINEEGNTENRCENEVSVDEMDASTTQTQSYNPERADFTYSKKEKKKSIDVGEPVSAKSLINAATLLSENIRKVGYELSRSIGS